jgi:hypothetical protein
VERAAAIELLGRLHAAQGESYRLAGDRIAGCRLLPLDLEAFDRIWA